MARTRTIHRRRKPKKAFGFLPESFQVFLARRIVDILGTGLCLLGGFLLLALTSYEPGDPSWNTAAGAGDLEDIANWAGPAGAWAADILTQTIGVGGFALALGFIVWGLRIFQRRSLTPLSLRLASLLLSALLLAAAGAQIPAEGWLIYPYLGSSAGTLFLHGVETLSRGYIGPGTGTALAAVLFLASFSYAAALSRDELASIFGGIRYGLFVVSSVCLNLFEAFRGWLAHYNDPSYRGEGFDFSAVRTKIMPPRSRISDEEQQDSDFDDDEDSDEDVSKDDMVRPVLKASRPASAPRGNIGKGGIPVVTPRTSGIKPGSGAAQQRFPLSETDGDWELPPLSLLQTPPDEDQKDTLNEDALRKNAELLQSVLNDFGIEGEIVSIHPGPVVTLYELEPAPGTKTSRVISVSDDIARSMSAISVRCAVVPGRNVIGIELPNKRRQMVYMQELLDSDMFEKSKAHLPLILGKDIGGQPVMADLAKMPHLLVAGTTGSGKSVAVNTMILSLLYRLPPEKCRFIMIDPKMLELSVYDDIPHLLSPVVTEPGKAIVALKWTVHEMEERYRSMSKLGVRNIEGYNERLREARRKGETIMQKMQTGFDPETGDAVYEEQAMDLTEIPYIVVVVDEFADLMLVAGKDVENAIQRLAQMARAAGIHLIMATQRPSVDVITGVIKANFPTRISFQVTSKIDSRTILGEGGAEQLLGMGDMLHMAPGGRITRVHGPFVSDDEVEQVVDFLKDQGKPAYIDSITRSDDFGDSEVMNAMFGGGSSDVDELYDQAVALVAREGKASTSFVQRYLQIGYNRAARIIEEMERQGVISQASPTGKREVLIRDFSDV